MVTLEDDIGLSSITPKQTHELLRNIELRSIIGNYQICPYFPQYFRKEMLSLADNTHR